jgi:DNA-binding response OmpR family regulator
MLDGASRAEGAYSVRILVIEDDPAIGRSLVQGFSEAGHDCQWVQDGAEGTVAAQSQQADAVVLDLMLPKRSGMEVLADLRKAGVQCPVILVTAVDTVGDRIRGLDAGADDYLVKPFDFAELLARINAIVRRTNHRPQPIMTVGDVTLDLTTRRVTRGGRDVDLTPIEFSMTELLMRFAGQVVTRKMLCEHVWGFNWDGTTNVIEVHVNRLRGKLDRGSEGSSFITTIRGRGYAITKETPVTKEIQDN